MSECDPMMDEHMKQMWAGQSNVLVSVRVRPLMKHDVVKKSCVRVLDNKVVIIMDPAGGDKADILRVNRTKEKQYAFDYVFDPASTQENAYLHTTKFLIHGVLDGFNATVFAYGQTGSGKTFTMIGTPSNPGIMVRVMNDLFIHTISQGKEKGVLYKVSVSFLEVYNENIRDLLNDSEEFLDLREDPIKGPVVAGITEVETVSSDEIMQLLHRGNEKRSQAATAANEVSSRSHAVLQVVVECKDRTQGVVANIKVGKLSLVDLAGSERAANTKNTGARLIEGANINRSLLALGNCINALGEKGNKGNFVPYRDSKLTRLLKDSLGGNCRTVMIANISSAESSFEETLNTLKYANRAKNIKSNVQRNVLNVNYHISEYVQLINNLREEINALKNQIPEVRPDAESFPVLEKEDSRACMGSPLTSLKAVRHSSSTPLDNVRDSLRAYGTNNLEGRDRELVSRMRQEIVANFQERMQLRRSLIELEDQNVQNGIEVSKRQLLVVHWTDNTSYPSFTHGPGSTSSGADSAANNGIKNLSSARRFSGMEDPESPDIVLNLNSDAPPEIKEAWNECESLRKAISKNNNMKKNISKRLRLNEKEAEKCRDELSTKITGEDRRELMELQYQVGRLELENMELEQHRIVHESILKGKDLILQKLRLQLAVRDKLIQKQQSVLAEHGLDGLVGYTQLALLERTLMQEGETDPSQSQGTFPVSPPRSMADIQSSQTESAECSSHPYGLKEGFSEGFTKSRRDSNSAPTLPYQQAHTPIAGRSLNLDQGQDSQRSRARERDLELEREMDAGNWQEGTDAKPSMGSPSKPARTKPSTQVKGTPPKLRQSAVGRVSRAGRQYKGRKVQGGGGVDDESTSKEKITRSASYRSERQQSEPRLNNRSDDRDKEAITSSDDERENEDPPISFNARKKHQPVPPAIERRDSYTSTNSRDRDKEWGREQQNRSPSIVERLEPLTERGSFGPTESKARAPPRSHKPHPVPIPASVPVIPSEKQHLSPRGSITPLVVLPRASHQPKQLSPFGLRRPHVEGGAGIRSAPLGSNGSGSGLGPTPPPGTLSSAREKEKERVRVLQQTLDAQSDNPTDYGDDDFETEVEEKVEEEKWSGGRAKSKIQPYSREKSSVHPEGYGASAYSNGGIGVGGVKLSSYQKPKLRRVDREKAEGEAKELESLGDLSLESMYVYDSPQLRHDADASGSKNKSSKNALLAKLKNKVARRNSYDSSEAEEEYPSASSVPSVVPRGAPPTSLISGGLSRAKRNRNLPQLARPHQSLLTR